MDINHFEKLLFEKALKSGFSDCEIYFERDKNFSVKVFRKELAQYQNSDTCGLTFRGIYNGKMGYSYTENIDDSIIDFLINSAKENAELVENSDEVFFEYDNSYPDYKEFEEINVEENSISAEEKINLAKEMETAVYSKSDLISSVDNCNIADGYSQTYISNTRGLNLSSKFIYSIAVVSARAQKNNDTKVEYEFYSGKNFNNFNPEDISKKVVDKVLSRLDSKSVKSGQYNIILKNDSMVDLLSTFVSNFYAENVMQGFSLLKDKIGEEIANKSINIYDEVSHKNSLKEIAFDSEGVPAQNKVIVENGVLKQYLYNLKWAKKAGINSTGNGFKSGFKSSVGTSTLNFYIEEGNKNFDDLLASLNNGLLITSLSGLHAGTNIISGDFSLLADGFFVENGKIKFPVEQITIASNFYDVLRNISDLSNDLYFDLPGNGGSIGAPSVLINNISVSGE